MPKQLDSTAECRAEAERLIGLARAMLNHPDDEMVVICLDQAIETLHLIADGDLPGSV